MEKQYEQREEDKAIAKAKIDTLVENICRLEKEQNRLATKSYSQSNPGAVMERRNVKRSLEIAQRMFQSIQNKL